MLGLQIILLASKTAQDLTFFKSGDSRGSFMSEGVGRAEREESDGG